MADQIQHSRKRFYQTQASCVLLSWVLAFLFAAWLFPGTEIRNDCGLIQYGSRDTLNISWFIQIFVGLWLLSLPLSLLLLNGDQSIAERIKSYLLRWDFGLFVLLVASILLYTLGLYAPILKSTRLLICDSYSNLPDSIDYLRKEGEPFLAIIVGLFTLVFPVIKYLSLLISFSRPQTGLLGKLLGHIAKFSMIDVFVIALLIFVFKSNSWLIRLESQSGVIYFGLSVLLSIVVSVGLSIIRPTASKT